MSRQDLQDYALNLAAYADTRTTKQDQNAAKSSGATVTDLSTRREPKG